MEFFKSRQTSTENSEHTCHIPPIYNATVHGISPAHRLDSYCSASVAASVNLLYEPPKRCITPFMHLSAERKEKKLCHIKHFSHCRWSLFFVFVSQLAICASFSCLLDGVLLLTFFSCWEDHIFRSEAKTLRVSVGQRAWCLRANNKWI